MTGKVLNVFANLETEFIEAKQSLKDVDDSIKKITGREPKYSFKLSSLNFLINFLVFSAASNKERPTKPSVRQRITGPFGNAFPPGAHNPDLSEEPARKRRFYGGSAFSRYWHCALYKLNWWI